MARASLSPSNNTNNSFKDQFCKEFCGGSVAVCYCPQCSAIFCSDCFNKEHQSERKINHEKVFHVKPICEEHQHTLEYFDLTSFQPLCIMCLTKLQIEMELQFHVVRNIDKVSSKLYSLLTDKIREAQDVVKNVKEGLQQLKQNTANTITTAKDEIHCLIEHFKTLLDEQEKEIADDLDNIGRGYLNKEETTGLWSLEKRLEDSIQQASQLVESQREATIGYEFPHCFNKLKDLCAVASKRMESKNELRLTVHVSRALVHGMLKLCDVMPSVQTTDECHLDSDIIKALSSDNVKVKLVGQPVDTMETNKQINPYGNDEDTNGDVNVENCDSTVTPIGDGDFYDNEPTNQDGHVDVSGTLATASEVTTHHDNLLSPDGHTNADPMASTPLTSMDANSVRRGRRVKLNETEECKAATVKRGRKRQVKSSPMKEDDMEWSPVPKRVLRSSGHETTAKTRTRRGGALIKEMDQCDDILTELWADEDSWPFVRLVDRRKCPEYYERISYPMSLEIVKENLRSCKYRSVVDFVKDMNAIIENCRTFNEPESDVHEAGNRLAKHFQRLLAETFPSFESVFQDKALMDSSL